MIFALQQRADDVDERLRGPAARRRRARSPGTWPAPPRISFAGPLDSLVSSRPGGRPRGGAPGAADECGQARPRESVEIDRRDRRRTASSSSSQDDGVGIPDSAPRSGLANIGRAGRALRGGRCRCHPGAGGRHADRVVALPSDHDDGGARHDPRVPGRRPRDRAARDRPAGGRRADLEVVGEAATVSARPRRIAATRPDVAVLDVRLPGRERHRPVPRHPLGPPAMSSASS